MNRQNARKSAQMLAERLRKFEERTLGYARFSKASAFHTDMARDNHAHFGSANVTPSEQGVTWQEAYGFTTSARTKTISTSLQLGPETGETRSPQSPRRIRK